MARLSFNDYLRLVVEEIEVRPEWRTGQAYFNVLHACRPGLSDFVRGRMTDPFLQDNRIPKFLLFVCENWDSKTE